MKIVKISKSYPEPEAIQEAVMVLRRGGTIVYPTDTAYALGCDAMNPRACARVFKIKQRPAEKRLSLIAGSAAMVKRFCKIDPVSARLIKKYWPGPLTLVLPITKVVIASGAKQSRGSTGSPRSAFGLPRDDRDAAIRVPDCKIARLLSLKLGRSIVSTSANLSGKQACYSVKCVLRQLKIPLNPPFTKGEADKIPLNPPFTKGGADKIPLNPPFTKGEAGGILPDLILDVGPLPRRKPSTIAEARDGKIVILREGTVRLHLG